MRAKLPAHIRNRVAAHPRHVGLTCLVAGLLLSGEPRPAAVIAALTLPALGLSLRRGLLAVVSAVLLLAGTWLGALRLDAIDATKLGPYLGHAVSARGYMVKRERPTPSGRRARVRLAAISSGSSWPRPNRVDEVVQIVVVSRDIRYPTLAIGDEVELRGTLEQPANGPDPEFDYAGYLRRSGVHAIMRTDFVERTGRRRGGAAGLVDRVRRRAEQGVGAGLVPPLAALARGIVLGQDELIPSRIVDSFKASGLAHLLAVSGQNVTLLAVLALPLLAALGLGRRGRLVGVLGLIVLYVPLTGASPSIMRAGAMGAAGVVAALAGRPASRWYALLLAAGFTLALDPRAWMDPGWQLSFAAVFGIFALMRPLRELFHRLPAPLVDATAMTVAATLATAPLIAFHFGRVSLASLAANLIALPVVAPIMWFGMLAAVVAQVTTAPAVLLNGVNGFCLAYLAAVADGTARLPGAVWTVAIPSVPALVAAYVVPSIVAAAFIGLRAHPRVRANLRARRLVLAGTAAVLAVLVTGRVLRSPVSPPTRFTATFLDVGQGDATLIQAPGGIAVLVDGGPPESGVLGDLRAAGVRSLDLVVLSHAQEDHQGGLEPVVSHLPVAALLDGGAGATDLRHRRIVALARRRSTRILGPRAGQSLRIGKLRLRVLSPQEPGHDPDPTADPNDRAIVLLASYGKLDLLLPADAESNITLDLRVPRVEVMKVAHHGSADEGLPALLEKARPRVAVIEVGAHNRFGHPHPDTLASLGTAVPGVFRTDRDGDVRITGGPRGPVVETDH
jgi:competence protein ComEC